MVTITKFHHYRFRGFSQCTHKRQVSGGFTTAPFVFVRHEPTCGMRNVSRTFITKCKMLWLSQLHFFLTMDVVGCCALNTSNWFGLVPSVI